MVTTAAPDTGNRKVLSLPATAMRNLTRTAGTTPGKLGGIALGLVVLSLLTGVVAAFTLQYKQDTIDDLANHREPLSAAAQQLYRSLSDADATASAAFLSGGVEPAVLRTRYEVDIAQAGAALAKATSDIGGISKAEDQVHELTQQLPVYTGLVETARANNRQGFPAGAAYLREASALMRSKILPAAQELYSIDIDRLTTEQDEATDVPWIAIGLVVLLLGGLIGAQIYLTRKTNRLLNVGLLVASAAVGIGLVWGSAALVIESSHIADGQREGSQQVDVLVQARIVALKCRANETLTLVARGDGPGYEAEFANLVVGIAKESGPGDLLVRAKSLAEGQESAQHVDSAAGSAKKWLTAHNAIRKADDEGDYKTAVEKAVGTAPDSAAVLFAQLDDNLLKAINEGRESFVTQTGTAGNALIGLVPGVIALALIAAAGVMMGIRQRLQEYR